MKFRSKYFDIDCVNGNPLTATEPSDQAITDNYGYDWLNSGHSVLKSVSHNSSVRVSVCVCVAHYLVMAQLAWFKMK